MTPTTLAETILRDVPIRGRIYTGGRINTGGNCLDELVLKKDVEAALTAAMDPALTERAGEVLSRLRKADEYEPLGHDGWEAADLITALLAQNAALRANTVQMLDEADREYNRKTNDLIERHAEQLAALRAEVRKSAMDAVSAGCQAQEAWEAQKAAEARAERLEAALRLLHDNVVLAFPALANLGPVANARAALSATEASHDPQA